MEKRILELALETLEQRKVLLQSEIESIQAELRGRTRAVAVAPAPRRRKRRMSAALRKAQSERMKKFWELRRQKAGKAARKSAPAKAKAKAKAAGKRGRPKKAEKQKETKVPF